MKVNIKIEYIYLVFLVLIFFIYGLKLSEIIDYIFPDCDENIDDARIALEIIGEVGITYLIYFILKKYVSSVINLLFTKISRPIPNYLEQLLLVAFSTGIYKHLTKSNNKILYFRKKIIKF